jgi:hypothetical protein
VFLEPEGEGEGKGKSERAEEFLPSATLVDTPSSQESNPISSLSASRPLVLEPIPKPYLRPRRSPSQTPVQSSAQTPTTKAQIFPTYWDLKKPLARPEFPFLAPQYHSEAGFADFLAQARTQGLFFFSLPVFRETMATRDPFTSLSPAEKEKIIEVGAPTILASCRRDFNPPLVSCWEFLRATLSSTFDWSPLIEKAKAQDFLEIREFFPTQPELEKKRDFILEGWYEL